jgi:hypothetical protein
MCKLLLSLGYGTEAAQGRAKRYVAEHGHSQPEGGKR